MPDANGAVLARQRARAFLGVALIAEVLLQKKLIEKGFDRLWRFGMRRELAGELGPRMLAPHQMPERPRLELGGGVRLVHLLLGPLAGRELLDLLVWLRFGRCDRRQRCCNTGLLADLGFDFAGERPVLLEKVAGVVLALP